VRKTFVKLSIFVVFTIAVTVLLANVIGNYGPFKRQYAVEAVFEEATGVLRGDLVTLAGVSVGKVESLRVEDGHAIVKLLIQREVQVPKQTRVVIRFRNLVGQRMISLEPPERASPPFLGDGDRIPVDQTKGSLDFGKVFNNLKPLVQGFEAADINTLSKALVVSFGEHAGDLDAIFADTARVTNDLAARDEAIASLVANLDDTAGSLVNERAQLQRLLTNLADITGVLADRAPEVDRILTNLDQATGNFGRLINDNRPGLDQSIRDIGTLLSLLADNQEDVNQIAGNLDDVIRATARATTYGEWANLYIFSLCESAQEGCPAPAASSSLSPDNGLAGLLFSPLGGPR